MTTEADWEQIHARDKRSRALAALIGLFLLGLITLPAAAIGAAVGGSWAQYLVSAGCLIAFASPLAVIAWRGAQRQADHYDARMRFLSRELLSAMAAADSGAAQRDGEIRRQQFESRVANALDMADNESEVVEVIERSFSSVLPGSPVELLLADNAQTHLIRMASVGPESESPGCWVDSPGQCPAARRAQIHTFASSEAVDACPKLRNRAQGPISAVCVPVSVMGRTMGVIHGTGEPETEWEPEQIEDLSTLAKLAGARIGMIRVMAETHEQASTDTLTGLLNRRSFEQKLAEVRATRSSLTIAMADLDHFKALNDTYGHDTGDRALKLFARVLRDSLRADDLICRYGGEEFALAFPACSSADAQRALDAVRARLDAALTVGGLPKFTVSFGVTDADPHEDLLSGLQRADAALFVAKHQGRDRVVLSELNRSDPVDGDSGPSILPL
jgi:diguanylate cyclase (GGDEF)-like protein